MQLYLVLEILLGGASCSTYAKGAGGVTVAAAQFYGANVVSAFEHFSSLGIVYRDTKPENIMLDQHGYLKVVDLGFAKAIDGRTYTFCGTPDYMAPEVIRSEAQTTMVDWWSIGVLLSR